jgi:hypothetical protein
MAYNDVYTGLSGSQAVAQTTALPIIGLVGTAAKRAWVVGVRVKVLVTAAAAGNDIRFQLARPGNTPTGTGLAGGGAHDFSSPASIAQMMTTWSTAPTVGTILAEWVVPQTTGSAWEEFPPTGDEWGVPAIANAAANAGLYVFAIPTVATSTPVSVDIIWGE